MKPETRAALGPVFRSNVECDAEIERTTLAIQHNPKDVQAYVSRANARYHKRDYTQALGDLEIAIGLEKNADAFTGRGFVYFMLREYEKALADLSTAICLDSTNAQAYFFRATLYSIKGQPENVIRDCSAAIQLVPEEPQLYLKRANAFLAQEKHDEALADFNQAIILQAGLSEAYRGRGYLLLRKGDDAKARAEFDKAIERNPHDFQAYFFRAFVSAREKNHVSALNDLDQAILVGPDQAGFYPSKADAHIARGYLHRDRGNYEEAIADFSEAARIDPKNSASFVHMGWILAGCPAEELRDGHKAIVCAEKAGELTNWKEWAAIALMAAAHSANKDFQQAVKWQTRLLEFPGCPREQIEIAREWLHEYENERPFRLH